MSKRCGNCNYQNEPEAQFCDQCGAQLDSQINCPNCQAENAANARFCNRCGQSLAATPSVPDPQSQPRTEPDPRSTPNKPAELGVSGGIGWQPTLPSQPKTTNPEPGLRFSVEKPSLTWREKRREKKERKKRAKRENQTIQGEVRGFNERQEDATADGLTDTIWTFRLERYQDGHRLQAIPVEMRGRSFTGFIHEGDIVRLEDKWKDKGVHRTKRLYNVTNNTMVEVKRSALRILGVSLLFIFILLVACYIFGGIAFEMITF